MALWIKPVTREAHEVREPLCVNHAEALAAAMAEGVLRHYTSSADGVYRDTVVFSILEQKWAAVRQSLRYRLDRGAS